MDNPILEDYLNELHKINPTINDYFMREEWENSPHTTNVYSEKYYKDLNRLNKDFLKG